MIASFCCLATSSIVTAGFLWGLLDTSSIRRDEAWAQDSFKLSLTFIKKKKDDTSPDNFDH